jgi:tRNA U34 5-methylaminomethyl-2-thiouridine-forming methyltransferase MnmC
MLKRKIINSEDGSPTIYVEDINEHYHSIFGARSESQHVFIDAGLLFFQGKTDELNILEIGLGTGLNAWLSILQKDIFKKINYHSIEKYPLLETEWKQLDYGFINSHYREMFKKIHTVPWGEKIEIARGFTFIKQKADLNDFIPPSGLHLIYYDAFAPNVQPALWSTPNFMKMYNSLFDGGILVTYSAKGSVKRNLVEAGFKISRLPGPRGKRHMLRAVK